MMEKLLLVLMTLLVSACSQKSDTIIIQNKGSDTLVNLAQAWAEEYKNVNPKVALAVSGGGSGTGIAALINGTVDIANSSRAIKPEERDEAKKNTGNDVKEFIVGMDALAVFIHPSNPISGLSLEEVACIYGEGGKCTHWSDIRGTEVSHEGSIQVFGEDIYHPTVALPELRKQVGMVFQKPNPLPLSIYENVIFGARTHLKKVSKKELDQMVESSLTRVGLWDDLKNQLNRPALSLSLEKQQRLCIARLLPLKPKLLLLDEPCSALDPAGIEAIETLIKDLKKDYSIIIVTHSMSQAKRVSDETIFMYMGELVEMSQTQELFEKPKEERTAAYIEGRFG